MVIYFDWVYIVVVIKYIEDWESSLMDMIDKFSKGKKFEEEEEEDENLLLIKIVFIDVEQKKIEFIKGEELFGIYYLEDSDDFGQGIVYSFDGCYIVVSSNGFNQICIWYVDNGCIYKILDGYSGSFIFMFNGKVFVSLGWDC